MAGTPINSKKTSGGHTFGQDSADLISFYGATPVAQYAAITALTTTPSTAELKAAVDSVIDALVTAGLIASA